MDYVDLEGCQRRTSPLASSNQSAKFVFVFFSFIISVQYQFIPLVLLPRRKQVLIVFVQNINRIHLDLL